jgi:hypothetical protein
MKEFEKWLFKNAFNHGIPRDNILNGIAEEAWRGALERLSEELGHSEGDGRIKDWIEKELGSK